MRFGTPALSALTLLGGVLLVGCAQNPYVLQSQLSQQQRAQQELLATKQTLENQLDLKEQSNVRLQGEVAQMQRHIGVLREELTGLRDRLKKEVAENTKLREQVVAHEPAQPRVQQVPQTGRPPGATITANNSLRNNMPRFDSLSESVDVRYDGTSVRIALFARKLFQTDGVTLSPEGRKVLEEVAAEVARRYRSRYLGIEGHTSTATAKVAGYNTNHALSIAQASEVFDYIVRSQPRLRSEQISVTGHGNNKPFYSTATDEGKRDNHRIELVVYPELIQ